MEGGWKGGGSLGRDGECRVAVLGEPGVGKNALVARFVRGEFPLQESSSVDERVTHSHLKTSTVAGKKVTFVITSCSDLEELSPSSPLLQADVFLLCFSIADHASLYTALDHWLPLLKDLCPSTPAVLVGCKSDLRTSSRLQRLVSAEHGLALSRQAGTSMYVETSAINNDSRSTNSAFEVACLASLGQFPRPPPAPRPLSRGRAPGRREASEPRCSGGRVRLNCLAAMGGERSENYCRGENYQHLDLISNQSRSGSVSSVSLQSKSSTLSSTTSETSSSERRASSTRASSIRGSSVRGSSSLASSTRASSTSASSNMGGSSAVSSPALSSATLASGSSPVLKVSTGRTPSVARRVLRKNNQTNRADEMVTIKCQRLREDRTFEEIEIEVPAGVYNNIQTPGDLSQCSRNSRERRSFGSRLRSLILKS